MRPIEPQVDEVEDGLPLFSDVQDYQNWCSRGWHGKVRHEGIPETGEPWVPLPAYSELMNRLDNLHHEAQSAIFWAKLAAVSIIGLAIGTLIGTLCR